MGSGLCAAGASMAWSMQKGGGRWEKENSRKHAKIDWKTFIKSSDSLALCVQLNRRGPEGSRGRTFTCLSRTAFIDLLLLCGIYCGICALPLPSPLLLLFFIFIFFERCPNRSKFRQVAVSMAVAAPWLVRSMPGQARRGEGDEFISRLNWFAFFCLWAMFWILLVVKLDAAAAAAAGYKNC